MTKPQLLSRIHKGILLSLYVNHTIIVLSRCKTYTVMNLEYFVVLEGYRKGGTGTRSMILLLSYLRNIGCKYLTLECESYLIPFYNRQGFTHTGRTIRAESKKGIIADMHILEIYL